MTGETHGESAYNDGSARVLVTPVRPSPRLTVRGGRDMADAQTTTCLHCGVAHARKAARYCSSACVTRAAIARRATAGTCASCGKPCQRHSKQCRECRVSQRDSYGRLVGAATNVVECLNCRKPFKQRTVTRKYCSRECAFTDPNWRDSAMKRRLAALRRAQDRMLRALRPCEMCGDPIDRWGRRGPAAKVCVACEPAFAAKQAKERHRKHYQFKTSKGICPECGKEWLSAMGGDVNSAE